MQSIDIANVDSAQVRHAGREVLSLALMDARNNSLRWAAAFEAAPAVLGGPLWQLGHIGWFQEHWIARNVQRGRGERCDPTHPKLASILPDADAHFDPANLPPHHWAITGRAKDGAVTLAYVPQINAPADPAGQRDMERNNSLVVRQNFGFGKVIFVGIDSTWRWRFKKGDTYNHRFWSQVIRWAASDRALVAGNEFVRFGAREPVYRADQEVEIVARFSDKVKKLGPDALAGARLIRKVKPGGQEENVGLMPLKPHAVIPREMDGSQPNLPPGEYDVELVIPDVEEKLNGPDGKKLRAHFQVLPADTGEMLDLGTNWLLIEDLAAKSEGKVFRAERAQELVELLQSRSATREYSIEQKMWQSWWTLILFVILLTSEWVVRKLAGLP